MGLRRGHLAVTFRKNNEKLRKVVGLRGSEAVENEDLCCQPFRRPQDRWKVRNFLKKSG